MLFPPAALERAITIREVVLRAMSGAISWMQAAEIIGCTERTCRARHDGPGGRSRGPVLLSRRGGYRRRRTTCPEILTQRGSGLLTVRTTSGPPRH
jgi:hypothetical protein